MKHNYLVLIIITLVAIPANAQWITLYEGGSNTQVNLADDWGSEFLFGATGASETEIMFGESSTNDNNCRLFYYSDPFALGYGGIYKKIPGMENYAALRIKLQMTLADSIGVINYYALNLNENGNPGNADSTWNHFGSDILNDYVYLSNLDGDSSIFLRTDMLRGDSVHFSYDHILIEADTTQMLNINIPSETEYTVFSSGSQIHIQTSNNQETYQYTISSLSGHEIIQGQINGNTSIHDGIEPGIYIVLVEGVTSTTTKKVYIN